MTTSNWSGFSKKSHAEKLAFLKEKQFLSENSWQALADNRQLPLETANQIVENVLGTFSLPFALAPNFLVDGKHYQLPMVTEEPSVVAAASYAAKLIASSGGFTTHIHSRKMIGQVALYDLPDLEQAKRTILEAKEDLLKIANQAYPSIVKRGGGARELWLETLEREDSQLLVLYFSVDTQEAMGANMVNTMAEALRQPLANLSKGSVLMAILSNYATESLVTATCHLQTRLLSRDPKEADKLAEKIALASFFAQLDPYRAATHNKGIFNGIDALVIATGNDWRAIEAGGHAFASKEGRYKGLTTWTYSKDKQILEGKLTMPLPIGTKGGSIGLNPTAQIAMEFLGQPEAKTLASLIAALGLAQNFAALKALTGKGIQAGHMKLHAKSLLLMAGADENQLEELVTQFLKEKHLNLETAQKLLDKTKPQV